MLEMLRFFMSMTGMAIPLGLLLMMAGRVRYRNELDTLVRVTSAFGITIAFYWLTGYSLSTSPSFHGLFGTGNWAFGRDEMLGGDATNLQTIFLFSVPSIVVATSLSERGTWLTSNILIIAVAALIVPIAAHWPGLAIPIARDGWCSLVFRIWAALLSSSLPLALVDWPPQWSLAIA